jgi:hypothetical protein
MRPRSRVAAGAATGLAVAVAILSMTARGQDAPLVLERAIALEHVGGRIDHMAVDLGRRRLIVAELGNGTVEIIDLDAGRVLHRIAGLSSPQGVGYAAAADRIVVASAGDGTVRLFRGDDFAPAGLVPLGDDADNVRIATPSGHAVVGYGDGGLAVIDPATATVVSKVKLPAHPEGFQLARDGGRAYVNLPDAHHVAVVDLGAGASVGTWRIPDGAANFPMALAGDDSAVAVVFRSPPRLVLLAPQSGAVTADLATCGDADDVFFDMRRGRIYVSCGAGSVDVFARDGTALRPLGRIATSGGARTALFVPELDRLFVAARAGIVGGEARILVLRPSS